ncbi:MAG: hypothetical protein HYZ72_09765 [Deltaproteobacteria bacterium]|nr:hypothetical protein [Deltaproteobacteria bacterium]
MSKTCRHLWGSDGRETTAGNLAHDAGEGVFATAWDSAPCTKWAVGVENAPASCRWSTLNITASAALFTLGRICPPWPPQEAITPTGLSPWLSARWWRTACPIGWPRGICGASIEFAPLSLRSKTGWRRREKKARVPRQSAYPDWALADFSGYLAVDELYEGPFCVVSAVDSPRQRRLLYEVLDPDPEHQDIRRFLARLHRAITGRGGGVQGITTEASPLSPPPIAEVFGTIPHQICRFHLLKELTKAIRRVVAQVRKALAAQAPALPRGRPKETPEAKRRHRHAQAIRQRGSELFEPRHLVVCPHLNTSQRATLQRLVRREARLSALRSLMDEVDRLFERRCRTQTALAKLTRLRPRVKPSPRLTQSLDKLYSPNLEKALTFLDDKLLPSTSNAVERGNRRHRKRQKTVYRVRTQASLNSRLALDLQRDQQAAGRLTTLACLHQTRA